MCDWSNYIYTGLGGGLSREVFKMYFVKGDGLHVAIYMQILQHCSQFTLCVGLGKMRGQV